MIIALFSDTARPSFGQSTAAGAASALGFVDPLVDHEVDLVDVIDELPRGIVDHEVDVRVDGLALLGRADGPLDPEDEMPEHLLGDEEAALELGDRLGRSLEHDDVVLALAVPVDLVREPAAAPGLGLHDLSAVADDRAGGPLEDRLGALVRRVRPEDEHEFVSAHAPLAPSCGVAPLT